MKHRDRIDLVIREFNKLTDRQKADMLVSVPGVYISVEQLVRHEEVRRERKWWKI